LIVGSNFHARVTTTTAATTTTATAAAAAAAAAATDQPRAPLKGIGRDDDIRLPMLRETGALRRSNYAFYSSKLA